MSYYAGKRRARNWIWSRGTSNTSFLAEKIEHFEKLAGQMENEQIIQFEELDLIFRLALQEVWGNN